jgi:hypothetical protein
MRGYQGGAWMGREEMEMEMEMEMRLKIQIIPSTYLIEKLVNLSSPISSRSRYINLGLKRQIIGKIFRYP